MADARDAGSIFSHDDLGTRVVVRRELPGDGPRYGDVLGVLTGQGDGWLRIETRRGPVEVALDTVVAARRVRPR